MAPKKYLYVIALADPSKTPEDGPQNTNFVHAFITAQDDQEAYSKGWAKFAAGDIPNVLPESDPLNDYVVELPHRLEA